MQRLLHLIRHPETGIDSNRQKPSDAPVDHEVARLTVLAEKLKSFDVDTFVTSDFERARQAAEQVTAELRFEGELYVDDLLREVLIWPDLKSLGYRDSSAERSRVAGLLQGLQHEVMGKLKLVVDTYKGEHLCLFTHGNFIRCVASFLEAGPIEDMYHIPINHLSITTVQYDDDPSVFTLLRLNDTLIQV